MSIFSVKSPMGNARTGRPALRPTAQQRSDVRLFAANGMSEKGIASAIDVSRNSLRKHFAWELRAGREIEMAANLRRLRKAADEGSIAAMKELDKKFTAATRLAGKCAS